MENFKWSYDPNSDGLLVWEVSGPESYATPQHMDKVGSDGYSYCAQGRITDGKVLVYADRPYDSDFLTEERGYTSVEARNAAISALRAKYGSDVEIALVY